VTDGPSPVPRVPEGGSDSASDGPQARSGHGPRDRTQAREGHRERARESHGKGSCAGDRQEARPRQAGSEPGTPAAGVPAVRGDRQDDRIVLVFVLVQVALVIVGAAVEAEVHRAQDTANLPGARGGQPMGNRTIGRLTWGARSHVFEHRAIVHPVDP
jgi:hypothetical protein